MRYMLCSIIRSLVHTWFLYTCIVSLFLSSQVYMSPYELARERQIRENKRALEELFKEPTTCTQKLSDNNMLSTYIACGSIDVVKSYIQPSTDELTAGMFIAISSSKYPDRPLIGRVYMVSGEDVGVK